MTSIVLDSHKGLPVESEPASTAARSPTGPDKTNGPVNGPAGVVETGASQAKQGDGMAPRPGRLWCVVVVTAMTAAAVDRWLITRLTNVEADLRRKFFLGTRLKVR